MTEPETDERTTGGLAGKVVGKAKELAGELTNNEDLGREGRLQQAQGEAAIEAARRGPRPSKPTLRRSWRRRRLRRPRNGSDSRPRSSSAAPRRLRKPTASRPRNRRRRRPPREIKQAEATREREQAQADKRIETAEAQERDLNIEALELEQRAREAESKAAALDPKETR